ncbi:MAG: hypothetical protein QXF28_02485 [Nitrososphaerota archaeon]
MKKSLLMIIILLSLQTVIVVDGFQNNEGKNSWMALRSWGLGLTIPDGSPLEDGSVVKWSEHKNVTVLYSIPNITYTDNTIYLIVSIMTGGGTIIQVATGIYPNSTYWSSYFMYVAGISHGGKTYVPVRLNCRPYFHPRDNVSISIYNRHVENSSVEYWASSVTNLSTGEKVDVYIVMDNSSTFKDGEQEVIAFESYTYNEKVFEYMGEATLYSILVDGKRVLNGWYIDDGQVFNRRPLFEVGGGQVPPFISIVLKEDKTIAWTYSKPEWGNPPNSVIITFFISILIISATITFYIAYRIDYRSRLRATLLRIGAKHSRAPIIVTRVSTLRGFTKGSRIPRTLSIGACIMFR